jgi:hypothetical protein
MKTKQFFSFLYNGPNGKVDEIGSSRRGDTEDDGVGETSCSHNVQRLIVTPRTGENLLLSSANLCSGKSTERAQKGTTL